MSARPIGKRELPALADKTLIVVGLIFISFGMLDFLKQCDDDPVSPTARLLFCELWPLSADSQFPVRVLFSS